MSRTTKIINIIGGPGVGKTTIAAGIFESLKKKHLFIEYVQEYAKKLVLLQDFESLNNQYMVSLKQYKLFKIMVGHIDYIITDGPLIHGLYYNRNNPDNTSNVEKTEAKILELVGRFNNINIVIERSRSGFEFETVGRMQTLEESKQIDKEMIKILDENQISYKIFGPEDKDAIIEYILSQ